MFTTFQLSLDSNIFEDLSNSVVLEKITSGRKGAVVTDVKDGLVPIVRTTTCYFTPAFYFSAVYKILIEEIREVTKNKELMFNNALVEIYNSEYRKMGYHSDQSLDLDPESFICIFSCYDKDTHDVRKLIIKNKTTNEVSELLMPHNSIILFSTDTNKKYLHKIILDTCKTNSQWLGVTFRLSKTFVSFRNGTPYIGEKILRYVDGKESSEFYKMRSEENKKVDYEYPEIDYTISISDTFEPIVCT